MIAQKISTKEVKSIVLNVELKKASSYTVSENESGEIAVITKQLFL